MQLSSEMFPGHGAGEGLGGAQCPHGLPGVWGYVPESQQLVLSPQRMKSSESTRLMAESNLREELESRWQKLHELTEERLRALRAHREVGGPGWPGGGEMGLAPRLRATSATAGGGRSPAGAVPGPGQSRSLPDQVCATEPGVTESCPDG